MLLRSRPQSGRGADRHRQIQGQASGAVDRSHGAAAEPPLDLVVADLLVEKGVVSRDKIYDASVAKKEKLKLWSNIFKNN